MNIFYWLIDPLSYSFMQRALIASLIIGFVCSTLSCFLVLKGWSMMGDAISHAVLPGIVIAFFFKIPLSIGAFFAGISCAIGTGYIKNNCRLKEDTILGILYTGMFSFGLILFTNIHTDQHLHQILFGNVLGISITELKNILLISITIILIILFKRRDLILYCFDSVQASILGIKVSFLHYSLLCLLGFTTIIALQAVGIVLVVAMLITPGITGLILSNRFDMMLIISLLTSAISSISGVIFSFYLDASTGPAIVLIQSFLFLIALMYNCIFGKKKFYSKNFK